MGEVDVTVCRCEGSDQEQAGDEHHTERDDHREPALGAASRPAGRGGVGDHWHGVSTTVASEAGVEEAKVTWVLDANSRPTLGSLLVGAVVKLTRTDETVLASVASNPVSGGVRPISVPSGVSLVLV